VVDVELPLIDEHSMTIDRGTNDVWRALLATVGSTFAHKPAAIYARIVGCEDRAASGPRPLAEGSTFPGFHVTRLDVGHELALRGRHRFSSYALTFRLDELAAGRTRLRAESRAEFPGVGGALYRAVVVGTRGHVLAVRRLLSSVRANCAASRAISAQ
jgi:hypothetical protein